MLPSSAFKRSGNIVFVLILNYAGSHRYENCCLIDSLRSLGLKLDYVEDGPFTIRQGNGWLENFGFLDKCL